MIVVGGEALVDLVPDGGVPSGELAPLVPRLGGGPYNVAIALGRLGAKAALLSRISGDTFGRALFRRLVTSGVDTSLVQRGDERTPLAVALPDEEGRVDYDFRVHDTADRLVSDPGPLPSRTRAVALGTLSLVLEPGAGVYETVLRRESERGVLVALDPNVRSALVPDPVAYRRRFEGWLPHVDLLKLSDEDARWLDAGSGREPMTSARRWVGRGPSAVVVTHGGAGMSVVTRHGTCVEVAGPDSPVVDTIGAGDTVQAALLSWLDQRNLLGRDGLAATGAAEWREALDFATRAAAVTCSRAGAEPPRAVELVTGGPSVER
ncbi:carbohydrate kinase family protein [Actinopolyspora mortivallis]|uniref:Carbohydrate kinase n=1 Tax=Actinopolyspora mortivallis TaxID=33906 RepID=A0A2T0GX47_ACTMO|nr:carbohydrate kinase [Actinopolyspora mortivallis]PRW63682.1 carbohydrate kinase [Actinopolyspora mortivallis]